MTKKTTLTGLFILLAAFFFHCGRQVEGTFWVEGACDSCKTVIEQAARGAPYVDSAAWDAAKSMLWVRYDTTRTHPGQIQSVIAAAGLNTQYFPANESARASLPACCLQPLKPSPALLPHP